LWWGRPDPNVIFAGADAYLVPFSLLWAGFTIFWEISVLASQPDQGGDAFFAIWGIPFVVFGLYFVAGRFFTKRYTKRRTTYAVTEDRAIVLAMNGRRISETPIRSGDLTITRARDGHHGSVVFGGSHGQRWWASPWMYSNTGMDWWSGWRAPSGVAFYDVDGFDGLARALELARSGTPPAG
jgi:hypothetical protein